MGCGDFRDVGFNQIFQNTNNRGDNFDMYQHLFVSPPLSKDTHELSRIQPSQEQHLGATCGRVDQSQAPK